MSNERQAYRALMNLIHNDLGITKEDIRDWIKDAIEKQAEIAIRGIDFRAIIAKEFHCMYNDHGLLSGNNRIDRSVLEAIAPYLAAQLTVSLKPIPEAKVVTSTGGRE